MINNIQNIHTSVVNSTFVGSVVKPSDAMDFFNMCNKLTQDQFLSRCVAIHGNKYDYSLTSYYNMYSPVVIICKLHGAFSQRPSSHVVGANCPKCSKKACDINASHRMSGHPLYRVYNGIIQRCYNDKDPNYFNYGARGIKMSEDLKNINVFIEYVSSLPDYDKKFTHHFSLDRINNDGNYERGNLRWCSMSTQNANKRTTISNTGYIGVRKEGRKYRAYINSSGNAWYDYFDTIQEALNFRNNIIITNNLPHKIQKYDTANI